MPTKLSQSLIRCGWAANAAELDQVYHDDEWGVPCFDDRKLFEFIILEGAQAGLSWATVLAKREGYRKAFAQFDPKKIAKFDDATQAELLLNPGIIRNRAKVASTIGNAKAYLEIVAQHGNFHSFMWQFVDGRPIQNAWKRKDQVPVSTKESDAMSKTLLKAGFKFVGTTICYAYMQAMGMVNDHTTDCHRYEPCKALGEEM
jgi:DNA-3-methyladenine glycosylase I